MKNLYPFFAAFLCCSLFLTISPAAGGQEAAKAKGGRCAALKAVFPAQQADSELGKSWTPGDPFEAGAEVCSYALARKGSKRAPDGFDKLSFTTSRSATEAKAKEYFEFKKGKKYGGRVEGVSGIGDRAFMAMSKDESQPPEMLTLQIRETLLMIECATLCNKDQYLNIARFAAAHFPK